jgi:rSAM/selenodomain-associated transferase 2
VNAPHRKSEPSIAVVVPVLNEAARIGRLLDDLAEQGFREVIVVDGGSDDATAEIVRGKGVTLIAAARGRGPQLNAGARAARGEVLLFLHADTRLPEGATDSIHALLDREDVVGGCFRLSFDERHPLLALYAAASALDSVFTTFGDQAFFVRARAFRDAGGFPDWPFLEDVELRRRLKRRGRFVKANTRVVTAARRFHASGIVRQQFWNALILGAFLVGVPAQRLARWYAPQREKAAAKFLTGGR